MANNQRGRLLTFYRQVLQSVDLIADEDGAIAFQPPGAVDDKGNALIVPAAVEGKRWVLPTSGRLDDGDWSEEIAFHPLSENFLNGESAVLAKLKGAMNLKLGAVLGELLASLTRYAADVDAQKSGHVGAKASKYLKLVPQITEKSAERMVELVERQALSPDRRFVNLYLKKGGALGDTKHTWVGIVGFPFRQELDGEAPKAFGMTLTKKDQASFKALFDYVMPDNDTLMTYSASPKSKSASKFDVLLRAYANVATQLNEMLQIHRKILPSYKELQIELDWMEELEHLDRLADVIPPLPGNIGEGIRDGGKEAVVASVSPGRAKRLFQDTEGSRTEREVVSARPASRVAPSRPEPSETPVRTQERREAREEDPDHLSFAERMRRRESGGTRRDTYRREPERSTYGSRNYSGTAPNVPDWAQEGAPKSRVIAGNERTHDRYGQRDGRENRFQGSDRSFSDRFQGRGGRSDWRL